ncbi:hypothetical protein DV453_000182 [Geotrichum candidum]|nr:hypothetical protein DV453_000182 [Geotrichum candidum]
MTDQFKGLTVKVALADGTSVIGLVTDVVNGQLSLSNGKHPFDRMLKGSDICDLELVQNPTPVSATPEPTSHQPPPSQQGPPRPQYYDQPPLPNSRFTSPMHPQAPPPISAPPVLVDPAILSSAPLRPTALIPPQFSPAPVPYLQPAFSTQFTETDDYDNHSSSESSVASNPYTAEHIYEPTPDYYHQNNPRKYKNGPGKANNGNNRRRNNGRGRQKQPYPPMESDGWATEDIQDIQSTDFDFQANLDRFDKADVFKQIRQNDSTSPSERLVAFNKVQKNEIKPGRTVGSNGQVKFGHKEMILEKKHSEWDHSDDDTRPFEDDDEEDDDTNDDYVSDILAKPPSHPTLRRPSRPQLQADSVKLIAANTKKQCLCTSPVQLVELERITSETFGIPDTILTENAGRGVARLAMQSLGGSTRFTYGNHNSRPLVVVFAGNSRTGARALAAARHLANRQVRIIALAVGCVEDKQQKGADDVLPEIKIQVKALESCKGVIVTRYEQFVGQLNMVDSPPELVIDGLQGYQVSLDDLLEDDLTTVTSCIEWANNKQKGGIISLDIPSGLDSATGLPGSNDIGSINAKWVLSCGLPLTGLKNAYLAGTVSPGDWTHYVVDVGFPRRSLQKGSLRRFGQIWFGAEWLLPLDVIID